MADIDRSLAPDILRERVRLLFNQLPFALISNIAISCGLVAMLWAGAQRGILLGWMTAVLLLGMVRWLLLQSFRRQQDAPSDPVRWARLYTATALMSGCLMGAAGVLFFQNNLFTLFALAIMLGGMATGSIMLHAAYSPAHLAYVLPVVLPFALRCILEFGLVYDIVGVIALVLLPVNLYLAKKIQRGLIESISLRFRNLALIKELTRQKELAQSAQAQAEQANAAKTRFFAAASHDLRQPVQALELFVAALDHELQGRKSRHLVENIRAAGREVGELLSSLLDFSKIDAAVIEPAVRDFAVADVLKRIGDDFVPQAAAHGLRCRVLASSAWVRSDPALLERILRNFMGNALKYTPAGRILLGCRREGGSLRIEVHDTGIGIPQHQHREVFNEFFQLDNPERDRQKGLGLGLAIVDGLAQLLAHPLTLRSQPQRGSMFAVAVPLAEQGVVVAAEPSPALNSQHGASILLVDDDQTIRHAATRLLENWGYAAVAAGSTDEALDLLRATGFRPDVILVDYRLRDGRTGVEAIRAVQAHCGHPVPAAIITGDTAPDRMIEAKASGYPLLHKPLSAAKLRTLLSNLLRS